MPRVRVSGSKIVPCPRELVSQDYEQFTVFGKGGSLFLCLFSHGPGDYTGQRANAPPARSRGDRRSGATAIAEDEGSRRPKRPRGRVSPPGGRRHAQRATSRGADGARSGLGPPWGCALCERGKDAGSARSRATSVTEDEASFRGARPRGRASGGAGDVTRGRRSPLRLGARLGDVPCASEARTQGALVAALRA